ncbi:MAG: multifunctional CCA tRNA nucleotidyl transferase/2'3'-cyclic phosphodiesterase/2'nucleotidase/phosphatase [Betaproteobacteria bacterium]|nr:multifunctional CCA tRNA nucleotidyl transferase/2'3'-cyclic phosphodiesterase/2'nucleotidase/phosphatase [Betaproteobacteria bacterium]
MKIYQVGGAVRDEILNLPVQDRDYVVVGASVEEMLKQGFIPVGNDFPVFLHPTTHEEYALARTERKQGRGYKGFVIHASPEVTLEEDLQRRDLTINAMARDAEGHLIDPYGGLRDCQERVLRHVSDAFIEDPVRILRVARFAARFSHPLGFSVAPETMALMQYMSASGEVDALVAERVWQEIARGLMENTPSELFRVLEQCGALYKIIPQLINVYPSYHELTLPFIDQLAQLNLPLRQRFAGLVLTLFSQTKEANQTIALLCRQLKCPKECSELATLTYQLAHEPLFNKELSAEHALSLIERADAIRRPQRYQEAFELVMLFCKKPLTEIPHHPLWLVHHELIAVKLTDPETLSVPEKIATLKALRLAKLRQYGFN